MKGVRRIFKPTLCRYYPLVETHTKRRMMTAHVLWCLTRIIEKKPPRLVLRAGARMLILTKYPPCEMNLIASYQEAMYRYHRKK